MYRRELASDQPGSQRGVSVGTDRWVLVRTVTALAIVLIVVVVLLFRLSPQQAPLAGSQASSVERIAVQSAAIEGWELLVPAAGELRPGFPPPMVSKTDRLCIGFARVDFGPGDVRPSLALCEADAAPDLAANEIRSIHARKSGFDTWHFLEAASPIEWLGADLASGENLEDNRIHLSGSTAALRLENGRDLASIEWSTASQRYRCIADPAAWRTSVFCTEQPRVS